MTEWRGAADQGFARTARRHRIGRAHAEHVIRPVHYTHYPVTEELDPRIEWVGPDDRGIELEIVAVDLSDVWLVIHVMPTALRRNR